ncbi:MAG: sulfite exporter TauE/SafE family protein [Acidimicrobiia bacterium]
MRGVIASPLAVLIGLSIGALGGGGSILAIPALVYGAGESVGTATGTSLVIVGASALVGVVPHLRNGRARVGAGVMFGIAGVGGNAVGTVLNRHTDPDVLLLAFSAVMVAAGMAMVLRDRHDTEADAVGVDADMVDGGPGLGDNGGAVVVLARPAPARAPMTVARVARVVAAGSAVGLLTGLFGVGGGFVIVPALVLTLGYAMPDAVGTSLLVIAINSATTLTLRSGQTEVDWAVTVPFLIAAGIGAAFGGLVAARVSTERLTRGFVVLLFAVAGYTAVRSIVALL